MQTDRLERELRGALRESLDREQGPDPTWAGSPVAVRVGELDRRRRWTLLRVLAVAAVLSAAGGAALLAGTMDQPPKPSNAWIAYTVFQGDGAAVDSDADIWFTALDQPPRRVVGDDPDGIDQACPAFSPDGRRLAYGSIEGLSSPPYQNSALVIADVADDGTVATRQTIDVGDGLPLACAVWSPASDLLAFGVPRTSPINPTRSGEGSEVWIVRPGDGEVTVIPDLLATDLEWSPDGSALAIAGGVKTARDGPTDARIHLYELSTGTQRTLQDTLHVANLTWSPDGRRIAYVGRDPQPDSPAAFDSPDGLWVVDVETGRQQVLADPFGAVHGIGPVWSPDGTTIAYQRVLSGSGEKHEVVLVTPDDRSAQNGLANEVVLPQERVTADGTTLRLYPWRVSWSPDGTYLLYVAWTDSTPKLMVAVPTDPDAPAVVLAEDVGAYEPGDGMRVAFQVWQRRSTNVWAPTPSPSASASPSTTSMWPQTTLEEVREAQKLATAGDPGYTWQIRVDEGQVGQNHPCGGATAGCWRAQPSGEIFRRFLKEGLGWDEFFWNEAFAHPDGLEDGDVVFVRCAPGGTNPLYPGDPETSCAPTIDELRYETVKITVSQPDRNGPGGIWVVTGWEMIEPAKQADSRVVEAKARALLKAFLQARIDGAGAEQLVDVRDSEAPDAEQADTVPLLYATSTGAPYERSEFEIVEGPVWPDGRMRLLVRLFAEDGETTVEQHFLWDDLGTGGDRPRLVYDDKGPGEDAATTENGKAAPIDYDFLDGAVTYRAADPLGPRDDVPDRDRLAIDGLLPDDDAPRRILTMLADPRPIGPGCEVAPAAPDAAALARSIGSNPDFEATAPVAVTIGGLPALRMDVVRRPACWHLLERAPDVGVWTRARLYLLDLPGASVRVLALLVHADDDSFETVLEWATPVIDSIEFRTP